MGRGLPPIRILGLLAALVLVPGCQERELLEKEAPALAHADLTIDRIAIAGVVSDTPTLRDTAEIRESWSLLFGNRLARDRFGKLPIVSSNEVRAILGPDDYSLMLDRFKDEGGCAEAILADLSLVLDGRARFIAFANIQEDQVVWSDSEVEQVDANTKVTTSKIKTMTSTRTTTVRLRFYDLSDRQLAWDHVTVGAAVSRKEHDMTDIVEHDPKEGFFGGLITSVVNSILKPDPAYPGAPGLDRSLGNAFDNVGNYIKPSKKKK